MNIAFTSLIRFVVGIGLVVNAAASLAGAQSPQLWGKLAPGRYPVGFRSEWQFDHSRRYNTTFDDKTKYADGPAPRPILMNIWYPAANAGDARRMPHRDYLEIRSDDPPLAKFAAKLADYNRGVIAQEVMQKPAKDLTDREKQLLDQFLDTPTACVRNAPAAGGRFPLVIYHSGHGSSFEDNAVLCEFLASHGFVVIGSAFQKPDGSSFGVDGGLSSAHDMAFLVSAAKKFLNVDAQRIGVVGHSGGAHAALTYGSLPGAAVDAVVSLDTTQDYHGVKDPSWSDMTSLVLKNRKHFASSLLMVAAPYAYFDLADRLDRALRFYFTIKGMGHDDFIAQGGISKERLHQLSLGDPKQTAESRAAQQSELATVQAGYHGLCGHILRFLEAELKGDVKAKEILAAQYRSTKLGGAEPHVEFVPPGRTGPEPYLESGSAPPTPRQLHDFLRREGSDKTIAVLRRFRPIASEAPIYSENFEMFLVFDLLDDGRIKEAIAFRDYYRETGVNVEKYLLESARIFRKRGGNKLAQSFFRRLLLLEPANQEAAEALKQLSEEKR